MQAGKTSTFTVHHDRCDPSKWTPSDVLTFAKFVKYGSLQDAAALSRLGVQLVLSEHHVPKGGTLEEIGWSDPKVEAGITEDLDEIADDDEITEIVRVYRGPVEYAVRFAVGNEHGDVEGHEHEIKATRQQAEAFLDGLYQNTPEPA
jgi:hypothetical protein